MNRTNFLFSLIFFCLLPGIAVAELYSFVADAVQAAPGHEVRRGKLYVSEHGTRFEFTAKKQKVIQIIVPSRGLFRLLFPKTKTYFEMKTPRTHLVSQRHAKAPCQPSEKVDCIRKTPPKGDKSRLEHWVISEKGSAQKLNVWWDPARHMYIKQHFPDGSKMLAVLIGKTRFEGLDVEQWRMTITLASGARHYSYMLFAPDLGFPVMEQGSKGLVKELHNIKPYKAAPALFKVPAGYSKVTVPGKKRRP